MSFWLCKQSTPSTLIIIFVADTNQQSLASASTEDICISEGRQQCFFSQSISGSKGFSRGRRLATPSTMPDHSWLPKARMPIDQVFGCTCFALPPPCLVAPPPPQERPPPHPCRQGFHAHVPPPPPPTGQGFNRRLTCPLPQPIGSFSSSSVRHTVFCTPGATAGEPPRCSRPIG